MRVKLCGDVVSDNTAGIYRFFGYSVCCPTDIRSAIEACPQDEDLVLEVNSQGGSVYAGFEMYSLLRAHKGRTVAEVQSIAASAMSVIVAACDSVLMSPVAQIMVHRASVYANGNSRVMKQTAQMLDTIDESILTAYQEKTGAKSDREKLARMMRNETFLTAQEAIDCGLADGLLETANETGEGWIPGLAVAYAGAEDSGVKLYDEQGKARPVENVVKELAEKFSALGQRLPPVEDLIRKKAEREGMDSRTDGVQDNITEGEERNGMDQEPKAIQTVEELTKAYPELTKQIAAAAAMTAAAAERKRIAGIDALAHTGFADIIAEGKADPNATAESVALKIIDAQKGSGAAFMEASRRDAEKSGVNSVTTAHTPEIGEEPTEEEAIAAAAKEAVALFRKIEKTGGEQG